MKILTTICTVLLGVCGTALAHDSMALKLHSSTAFMVGGTELPAGDNTIQMLDSSDGNIVLLVRSTAGPKAMVLTNPLHGTAPVGHGEVQVSLQHRGNVYRLDQIWLPDHTGFQILHAGIE